MDLQQMQQATPAPEPGDAPQKAEETTESVVKANVTSVTSAGYVWIYNVQTYEPSKCNRNMLGPKLQEKFPAGHKLEGKYVWTTTKPGEPVRGQIKCLLHPDDPNRKHYDELGFATCNKHQLTSPFQRDQHMERRHPVEWKTIEKERLDKEKQEDREYQRGVLETLRRSNNGSGSDGQTGSRVSSPSGQAGVNKQGQGRT